MGHQHGGAFAATAARMGPVLPPMTKVRETPAVKSLSRVVPSVDGARTRLNSSQNAVRERVSTTAFDWLKTPAAEHGSFMINGQDKSGQPSRMRVGVPGGRQLNTHRTARELLCHWRGSAVKVALTDPSTYAHLVVFGILFAVAMALYEDLYGGESDSDPAGFANLKFDSASVGAVSFLVTFSLGRCLCSAR
ncbi:hypothetical protein OAO87_00305 [bacterium]|nr:hypothetical protein [bacterium]